VRGHGFAPLDELLDEVLDDEELVAVVPEDELVDDAFVVSPVPVELELPPVPTKPDPTQATTPVNSTETPNPPITSARFMVHVSCRAPSVHDTGQRCRRLLLALAGDR
jgi:hypothetical protein